MKGGWVCTETPALTRGYKRGKGKWVGERTVRVKGGKMEVETGEYCVFGGYYNGLPRPSNILVKGDEQTEFIGHSRC